jgi:hypothetical protein
MCWSMVRWISKMAVEFALRAAKGGSIEKIIVGRLLSLCKRVWVVETGGRNISGSKNVFPTLIIANCAIWYRKLRFYTLHIDSGYLWWRKWWAARSNAYPERALKCWCAALTIWSCKLCGPHGFINIYFHHFGSFLFWWFSTLDTPYRRHAIYYHSTTGFGCF